MITPKEIIARGYSSGKWIPIAVKHINEHQLEGDAIDSYLESLIPKTIDPLTHPIPYVKNIRAESEIEAENIQSVFNSMDLLMKTPTLVAGAVMPDACPVGGKGQIPVGGIAVAKNAIHPAMHSADICCSVMMTNLGKIDPKTVMDIAFKTTHFGFGGREEFSDLPEEFIQKLKENDFLNDQKSLFLARRDMGTQGDGNHFLFIGKSKNSGDTVMVTHHGSRGLGAYLYKKGMIVAEHFRKEIAPKTSATNAWIPFDTKEGKEYWEALQLVREWTKMNHTVLHDAISQQLNVDIVDRFWNEHNFVFKKGDLFYHAKGATPLTDEFVPDSQNGLRLIPLNMSQPVLVVKGNATENNLGFAPHGAGRNVSRGAHIRSKEGKTHDEIFIEETKGLDVRFYTGNIDISELPSAYKDAETVKAQMKEFGLGEVVDEIIPYGSIMAGDTQSDAPWMKKRRAKIELAMKK